jgi:hypothetical protein
MLSGVALTVVGLPSLDGATRLPTASLAMFPTLVVGLVLIGVASTAANEGASGIRELRSRFARPVKRRWWLVLGALCGPWHFPVVDSLGAASPHGRDWPEFFGAFAAMLWAAVILVVVLRGLPSAAHRDACG